MKALRWLSSDPAVLPAIKEAGAISYLVPFLSAEREIQSGPEVQLEALRSLYNICMFNKKVRTMTPISFGFLGSQAMRAQGSAQGGLGAHLVPDWLFAGERLFR